jgi:site-specific DNA-methyltransferase (adenine-specific)
MDIIMKSLGEITPYEKNAKKHDETQINNVAESIRQYGFVQPIVIDKEGVIVIGHCRALAAKKLGMDKVPCVCVDDLTPEQVDALRVVDNKTNESEWDLTILSDVLKDIDLSAFDLDFHLPTEITDEMFDNFFENTEVKKREPQKVQCPHCGEWFEV